MKNIIEKLNEIQQELKVPKSQRNDFGKYNYRSCEDILESVKPILGKTKTVLTITDEVVAIGNDNYVKAIATLFFEDEKLEVSALAKEAKEQKGMSSAQITGATSSYARKYALNGLFAIDDTKDADTQDNASVTPKTAPKSVETTEKVSIRQKAENDIKNEDDVFGLNNLNTKIQQSKLITDKDKEELSFIINEKLDALDPTK